MVLVLVLMWFWFWLASTSYSGTDSYSGSGSGSDLVLIWFWSDSGTRLIHLGTGFGSQDEGSWMGPTVSGRTPGPQGQVSLKAPGCLNKRERSVFIIIINILYALCYDDQQNQVTLINIETNSIMCLNIGHKYIFFFLYDNCL